MKGRRSQADGEASVHALGDLRHPLSRICRWEKARLEGGQRDTSGESANITCSPGTDQTIRSGKLQRKRGERQCSLGRSKLVKVCLEIRQPVSMAWPALPHQSY